MSTVEQKLSRIEMTVLQEANAKADDMISKALELKKQELEKSQMDTLQRLYHEVREETNKIRTMSIQNLSKHEMENKKMLLAKRSELVARIFGSVSTKLSDFVNTPEYEDLFSLKLKDMYKKYPTDFRVFHVKHSDDVLKKLILSIFGPSTNIVDSPEIKIGGFRIVNDIKGIFMDETFDSKLEDQKSWFYANSGLVVD